MSGNYLGWEEVFLIHDTVWILSRTERQFSTSEAEEIVSGEAKEF